MSDELKEIKKIYGEEMVHLCSELFPNLLKHPGLLLSILKNNLAPTKTFASDVINGKFHKCFKYWINDLASQFIDMEGKNGKNPFKLMDEAGYVLYQIDTEGEIDDFKKYYSVGEVLRLYYIV